MPLSSADERGCDRKVHVKPFLREHPLKSGCFSFAYDISFVKRGLQKTSLTASYEFSGSSASNQKMILKRIHSTSMGASISHSIQSESSPGAQPQMSFSGAIALMSARVVLARVQGLPLSFMGGSLLFSQLWVLTSGWNMKKISQKTIALFCRQRFFLQRPSPLITLQDFVLKQATHLIETMLYTLPIKD